jgi:hypothetical protein
MGMYVCRYSDKIYHVAPVDSLFHIPEVRDDNKVKVIF